MSSKHTSSTDPKLRPVTANDLDEYEAREKSFIKRALHWKGTMTAIFIAPFLAGVGLYAWGQGQTDKLLAPLHAKDASIEQRVEVLEKTMIKQEEKLESVKEQVRGVRDDLRVVFPRLPSLPVPDGGL